MTTPTESQIKTIKSMCEERSQALATDTWRHVLSMPMDSKSDASALITVLKAVPTDPVKSDPVEVQKIGALRAAIPNLSGHDLSFAVDLVSNFDRKGRLSDSQWKWVGTLTQRASQPVTAAPTFAVGDIVRIGDDEYVVFVKRRDGQGVYAKRLTDEGTTFVKGDTRRAATGTLLEGDEKAAVAARFGKASAHCCFCSRALSTKESLAVGYGPDCASKYGLPWGVPVSA